MKKLLIAIKWDALLIYKYGIVAIAVSISAIYSLAFILTDTSGMEKLVTVLVFTDPVMYGFLFTSVMLLFEKDANTHQVLAVSTLTPSQYILSKATIFTLLSLICSMLIILAAHPGYFQPILFITAIILSATLFVFIGIIGVSFVNSLNQFILLMPIVLAPTCLPFLSFFNLVHSWWFYLIPTQASLFLFESSVVKIESWKIAYALIYLVVWNIACYYLALKLYKKRILKISSNE